MNDYSRSDLRTIIRHRRNIATIHRHTNTLTQLALLNIRENINTQIQEQLLKERQTIQHQRAILTQQFQHQQQQQSQQTEYQTQQLESLEQNNTLVQLSQIIQERQQQQAQQRTQQQRSIQYVPGQHQHTSEFQQQQCVQEHHRHTDVQSYALTYLKQIIQENRQQQLQHRQYIQNGTEHQQLTIQHQNFQHEPEFQQHTTNLQQTRLNLPHSEHHPFNQDIQVQTHIRLKTCQNKYRHQNKQINKAYNSSKKFIHTLQTIKNLSNNSF